MAEWFGNDELSSMDLQYDNPYQTFTPQLEPVNVPQMSFNFGSVLPQQNALWSYEQPRISSDTPFYTQPMGNFSAPQQDSGSNYWKSLTEGIGGAPWGDITKYGLMGAALVSPILKNLFTNTNQQRDDYANWLAQFNQTQEKNRQAYAGAQTTENTATEQAKQWWQEQTKLQPDQTNAIMAQFARALSTGERAQRKRAAEAGFARAPSSASMIQSLAPSLLQSLTTRNTVPMIKANTITPYAEQAAPFANLPATSSIMGDYTGALSNIANYGLGQATANLFQSPYQKAMTDYLNRLPVNRVG